MNPNDHVEPVRHHLTFTCTNPRWTVDGLAAFVAEIIADHEHDGESFFVEVFDENYELVELRRTRDDAFRVIGTGAIHLLKQGDGWERYRQLVESVRTLAEELANFESSAKNVDYHDGEEDGVASAASRFANLIEKFEER